MARKYGNSSSQGMRNLRSAGWEATKLTGRSTEKAAVGFAKFAMADHSGMTQLLAKMPSMGVLDTIQYILILIPFAIFKFFIYMAIALLQFYWIFLLIVFGIPFLLTN